VQRVALLLRDLLGDYPEQSALAREILLCEQDGDRIAHDILHRLACNGHRRAALDAADVHALTGALDDIVDYAEEVADQLGVYGVEAPMEQAEQLATVLVGCAEQVAAALRGLRSGDDLSSHSSRSTGSRTRAIACSARLSGRCSRTASTDDADPLEGHLRHARVGCRRVRDGRERARGHLDQARAPVARRGPRYPATVSSSA
jgi:hypothetical protein